VRSGRQEVAVFFASIARKALPAEWNANAGRVACLALPRFFRARPESAPRNNHAGQAEHETTSA
jgi:hypothetical protein